MSKIALLKSLSDIKKGQFIGVRDAYKKSKPLFWGYLFVSVISWFAIMGGYFLLIIPGAILGGYLLFCVYEYIHDDKKKFSAFLSSWTLVKGRWWEVFWSILLMGLMLAVISLCSIVVFGAVAIIGVVLSTSGTSALGMSLLAISVVALVIFILLVIQPLVAISLFEFYLSLKELPLISSSTEALDKTRRKKIIGCAIIGPVALALIFGVAFTLGAIKGYKDAELKSQTNSQTIVTTTPSFPDEAIVLTPRTSSLNQIPYVNKELGISLNLPKDWEIEEDGDGSVTVRNPNQTDSKFAVINIDKNEFPESDFTNSDKEVMEKIAQNIIGTREVRDMSFTKYSVSNQDVYLVTGTITKLGFTFNVNYHYIRSDNTIYIITELATVPYWTSVSNTFSDVISTVKLIK
jgi:hypothetical protein